MKINNSISYNNNIKYQPAFKAQVVDTVLMNILTNYSYTNGNAALTYKNKSVAELLNKDFDDFKLMKDAQKEDLGIEVGEEIIKKYKWLDPIVQTLANTLENSNYNLYNDQKKSSINFFKNRAYREVKYSKTLDITLDDDVIKKLDEKYFKNSTMSAATVLELLTGNTYSFDSNISHKNIDRAFADLCGVRVTDLINLRRDSDKMKDLKAKIVENIANQFSEHDEVITKINQETLKVNAPLRDDQRKKFRDIFIKAVGSDTVSFKLSDELKEEIQAKYF